MKRLLFFLILIVISVDNTYSAVSSTQCSPAAGSNSNGIKEISPFAGCGTNNYYNSNNISVAGSHGLTPGNMQTTTCPGGTFPVSFNGSNLVCNKIDNTDPTITDSYTPTAENGVWVNGPSRTITLTPNPNLGPNTATQGRSGIQFTRYCTTGPGCIPATNGTTINIPADFDNTVRYQTWDYAQNTSTIGSFIVRLDNTIPRVSDNYLQDNVWNNSSSINVTLIPVDVDSAQGVNSGINQTRWCEGAGCNPLTTGTFGTNVPLSAPYNDTINYVTWDNAGNASAIESFIAKLDDRDPNPATDIGTNIIPSIASNELSAIDDQVISVRVNRNPADPNVGAPIVSIDVEFERYDNESLVDFYNNRPVTSQAGEGFNEQIFSYTYDIRDVDVFGSRISGGAYDGSREYSYRIVQICDEAGNCYNGSYGNDYYVYPNTIRAGITSEVTPGNSVDLGDFDNVADGASYSYDMTLLDTYGNAIIPASGINREIDFIFNVNNFLSLDQYSQSTDSSVFIETPNSSGNYGAFPRGNTITPFIDEQSNDGVYLFNYKVFTPTSNDTSGFPISDEIYGLFNINSVTVDVRSDAGFGPRLTSTSNEINIDNDSTNFRFRPLYSTNISGELITNGTFLEGSIQRSQIDLSKELSGVAVAGGGVYLEFGSGGTNESSSMVGLSVSGSHIPGYNSLVEGNQASMLSLGHRLPLFLLGGYNIDTLLLQATGATLDSITSSHFSTHIAYTIPDATLPLGSATVYYNSDIFGKSSYWSGESGTGVTQKGAKVLGTTTSTKEKTHELTGGQDEDDLHMLGKFVKSSLRQDVRRSAYVMIKNVEANVDGGNLVDDLTGNNWTNGDGKRLLNNKVLYFGSGSEFVQIGNGGDLEVQGNKTLVIEGKDLYINNNMYYTDKNKDILGIIVLKDSSGNGGSVYIHPEVTNIVGTIYADKSMISAIDVTGNRIIETNEELGGGLHQSVLANQLHIYGSIFSENTLGGSRAAIIKCPYYVPTSSDCFSINPVERKNEAQKYDLNYLRRFTLNAVAMPLNSGKVMGNGTCNILDTPICTIPNFNFARYIESPTEEYGNYPVMIEYNSSQQVTPPPLFSK